MYFGRVVGQTNLLILTVYHKQTSQTETKYSYGYMTIKYYHSN